MLWDFIQVDQMWDFLPVIASYKHENLSGAVAFKLLLHLIALLADTMQSFIID